MTKEEAIENLEWLCYEVYNEDSDGRDYAEAIDMAIYALQQLQKASEKWISCSDRLPDTSDHVLATIKWSENDYDVTELDYFVTKYVAEKENNEMCNNILSHMIAWRYMPLPYKDIKD